MYYVWKIYTDTKPAPSNPWNSLGLEWQTPTPVPFFNFERIPVILSDPYHYDEVDPLPVADLGLARVPAAVGAVANVDMPSEPGVEGSDPGGSNV